MVPAIRPYGQAVEFAGLDLAGAVLEQMAIRPAKKYVAYGDSMTHGFRASGIETTYPWQIGEALGYQTVNIGF